MDAHPGLIGPVDLPHGKHLALWDRILLPAGQKERLVHQILLELTARPKLTIGSAPLHGVILLAGPPGTGKTSLAKAAPSKAAQFLKRTKLRLVEVEPHGLTSAAMGKTQRHVKDLFQGMIRELATAGPLVVVLDEVETLAASRHRMSMEANPIDVHRATDAVLASLDMLAEQFPHLLFIATTNFETAVDDAFTSRADCIVRIGKPGAEAREAIVVDSLNELGRTWPQLKQLSSNPEVRRAARDAEGLDGRQLRKAVLEAATAERESALDLNKLTPGALVETLRQGRGTKE